MLKSKFDKDTIWLSLAQIILASAGILINIIIGNKYGSADLGIFNQSVSFFFLLSALIGLGLNNSTIKRISENPNDNNRNKLIVNSNLIATIIISFLVSATGFFTIDYFKYIFSSTKIADSLKIILISVPIYNFNKILMSTLNALRDQKQFSIARIIRWKSLIIVILFYCLIYSNIDNIYYSFLISEIILMFFLIKNLKYLISLTFSFEQLKKNLKFGGMTYISEIISFSKDKLDIIILGYFLSSSQMGIFSFSYSFASGILLVSRVFMQNFNPIISNLWKNRNFKKLKMKIMTLNKKVLLIQSFTFIIAFLGFNLFVPYIVSIPIADNFFVFNFMLIGFFIFSTISWLGSFLVMTGNLILNIYRVSTSLVFSICSISFFSYNYGINGAAVAVLISNIFNFILIKSFMIIAMKKIK